MLGRLPPGIDLEGSARASRALVRRRAVNQASDLLRMVLAYAVCDWSFRVVGAWCTVLGLGVLSDVAVRKRLQGCQRWLGILIAAVLKVRMKEGERHGVGQASVRVRLMDATCVSRPGSTGTDWRVHLSLDLESMCVDGLEVTDSHTGETFAHCPTQPGDIRVGDRGYGYASSLTPVLVAGGWVAVRINWQNLPLEDRQGNPVNMMHCLQSVSLTEYAVALATDQGYFPLRLIVAALPQEAADRARQRVHKQARKKGKTPSAKTLLAAGFVVLLTNLPASLWPPQRVLALYRFRWQIELFFKRLKSLLHLDHLRAQTPALAQVYLLGKLLGALLLDDCLQQVRGLCPTWFNTRQPVSLWRLSHLFIEGLRSAIRGPLTLPMILAALPRLTRFLCGPPRLRPNQLALAHSLLSCLS